MSRNLSDIDLDDAVEYFHFKVNKLKKEGANYEGK